jgi:hypothetical protein
MVDCAQSALSRHFRKRYKCPTINQLRGKADKAREGPWRFDVSFLKSDLALADMQNAIGGSAICKVLPGAQPHGIGSFRHALSSWLSSRQYAAGSDRGWQSDSGPYRPAHAGSTRRRRDALMGEDGSRSRSPNLPANLALLRNALLALLPITFRTSLCPKSVSNSVPAHTNLLAFCAHERFKAKDPAQPAAHFAQPQALSH